LDVEVPTIRVWRYPMSTRMKANLAIVAVGGIAITLSVVESGKTGLEALDAQSETCGLHRS
jgi:hypothetical protein